MLNPNPEDSNPPPKPKLWWEEDVSSTVRLAFKLLLDMLLLLVWVFAKNFVSSKIQSIDFEGVSEWELNGVEVLLTISTLGTVAVYVIKDIIFLMIQAAYDIREKINRPD
jgi:hypothetical protein